MMRWLMLLLSLAVIGGQSHADENWPSWRGRLGTGEAVAADPPVEWSESKNVRWKVAIPGQGHSTPIVWDGRLFLTLASPIGEAFEPKYSGAPGAHDNLPVSQSFRFAVRCYRLEDGELLWEREVCRKEPHEGGHYTGSQASASPVTDGKRVYASFGSHGLYCLDLDGKVLWEKQLGVLNTKHGHGEGSSPALADGVLVVNSDHEGESFLVALKPATGEEVWRVERDEVTSWASPIIVEHDGKWQAIVCGTHRIRGYDLTNGDVLWSCGGLSSNVVATPIYADGMLFAASSYDTRAMLAIRLDGAVGDVTGTDHVVWSRTHGTPYVPSPLLYEGSLYFLRHYQGIMTRVEAATGDEQGGPMRLGEIKNVFASPLAAAGRVYVSDRDGVTQVVSHQQFPRTLSVNRLDDQFSASAVAVGKRLILRGEKSLYCIAEDD